MSSRIHDVIIVGSGLAGAAAAYQLSRKPRRILLIEAQARIGGRAYARRFRHDGTAELLEYGGSWITPWHERIRSLCRELGLALRPRTEIRERLAMRDGVPCPLAFADDDERLAHDRAVARIAADAMMLKAGLHENERGETLSGISYAEYMARLKPPLVTRHLQDAWWIVSGGGSMDEVSAGEFLHSCSYESGLAEDMIKVWAHTVEPSMDALAARLVAASGASVLLSSPVTRIVQDDAQVCVALASGEEHRSTHAVVATGINPMQAIAFTPPLTIGPATAVTRGQKGRAFKLWIKARGVPLGRLVTGDGTGVQMIFSERAADDGSMLLIGFGLHDEGARPADESWVRAELARLCPNAELLAHDWHDWLADPYARGTWLSTPYDLGAEFASGSWGPQGRIAFASSDIAAENAGWFEGAVCAGEAAAAWIASHPLRGSAATR
ncbi:MAG: FAD-dependent oxidoreductase [Rhizobiales bacterium]|nr:FAD-dependent oxidoreductase [Hyphomicrobiales bacterium]